jgi:hypothetical protein
MAGSERFRVALRKHREAKIRRAEESVEFLRDLLREELREYFIDHDLDAIQYGLEVARDLLSQNENEAT